jgi:hypothetical protein
VRVGVGVEELKTTKSHGTCMHGTLSDHS